MMQILGGESGEHSARHADLFVFSAATTANHNFGDVIMRQFNAPC